MTERLGTALKLVKYAIANNISLKEVCRKFDKSESYLRNTRNEYSNKKDPSYIEYVKLYNQVLQNTTSIKNNKEQNLVDVLDAVDETDFTSGLLGSDTVLEDDEFFQTESDNGRKIELDYRGNKLIKTVEDLIKEANIDLNVWKKEKAVANNWFVTMKGIDGKPIQAQNFQVKVWLSRIRSVEEQTAWDNFLANIRNSAPSLDYLQKPANKQGRKYLLEVSIPDLHIGKLAWEDESGENYDTKIAVKRYNECIDSLLSRIVPYKDEIEEIVLPIGNDLINIDNMANKTTAGTEQRVDSRWQQMFTKARDLMIENINKLSAIAPVRVLMVSGNHDFQTVYYLGCVLEAYYYNSNNVTIDNTAEQMKYHEYGINMVAFTHGNEEKHQELGLIIATRKAEMWARTKCRQVHLGHFHSRKTTKYLDVQEFQGFTVRVLPSLSGTDDWHNRKGYISVKSGVAFLYDKENGLVGEFSHNVL
jgi:hypothetical protein